jgi:hypothetical protein
MGDWYYFWLGIFVIQGIFVDVVIALAILFSVFFLLYKLVNYLLRAQKERAARSSIETQVNALLRDIEGL